MKLNAHHMEKKEYSTNANGQVLCSKGAQVFFYLLHSIKHQKFMVSIKTIEDREGKGGGILKAFKTVFGPQCQRFRNSPI